MQFITTRPQIAARPLARTSVVSAAKFRPQSRIGKVPIAIPSGVSASVSPIPNGSAITIKGPKGELTKQFNKLVNIDVQDDKIVIERANDTKKGSMMHGTARAITSNMVKGVSDGWSRELELRGVGYRANVQGQELTMTIGFCHPVIWQLPDGITATVEKNTQLKLEGIDNELLGNMAAKIRGKRPPEPYKGKGVRYKGEVVRQKAGKAGKA